MDVPWTRGSSGHVPRNCKKQRPSKANFQGSWSLRNDSTGSFIAWPRWWTEKWWLVRSDTPEQMPNLTGIVYMASQHRAWVCHLLVSKRGELSTTWTVEQPMLTIFGASATIFFRFSFVSAVKPRHSFFCDTHTFIASTTKGLLSTSHIQYTLHHGPPRHHDSPYYSCPLPDTLPWERLDVTSSPQETANVTYQSRWNRRNQRDHLNDEATSSICISSGWSRSLWLPKRNFIEAEKSLMGTTKRRLVGSSPP